jgi:hypothetical protein
MKQLKKSELMKRVDDTYIFGEDSSIIVDEFIFDGNKYITGRYRVYKGGMVELLDSDLVEASKNRNRLELTFDDFKSTVQINYINKVVSVYSKKVVVEVSESSSKTTDISVSGDFVYNDDITINPIIGQVIYTNTFIAPVVRICKSERTTLDDILSIQIINLSQAYTSKMKDLLFNSFIIPMKIRTEETKITESIYPVMPVENRVNAVFVASSLPKEKVTYNDNGEVIKYSNPMNRIKMTKINTDKGFVKKVFFRDYLFVYDSVSTENNVTTTIHYDIINGCTKCVDTGEEQKTYPCSDLGFLNGTKIPKKTIFSEDTNGMINKVDFFTICTEKDELLAKGTSKSKNNSIMELRLYSDEKFEDGQHKNILQIRFDGSTMFKVDYRLNLESESGIQVSTVCFDTVNNFNRLSFKEYKDNDIHFKADENGNIVSYQSNLLDDGEFIYTRDMFGIPELYAKKVNGVYQRV